MTYQFSSLSTVLLDGGFLQHNTRASVANNGRRSVITGHFSVSTCHFGRTILVLSGENWKELVLRLERPSDPQLENHRSTQYFLICSAVLYSDQIGHCQNVFIILSYDPQVEHSILKLNFYKKHQKNIHAFCDPQIYESRPQMNIFISFRR